MFSIADNLKSVRQRIQKATNSAQREPTSVQLLPVTKTRTPIELSEVIEQGLTTFGENYLNEALDKKAALEASLTPPQFEILTWHFIGPIQSNKTRAIAEHFDWVQSLDREKIAQRLNDQRPDSLPPLNVCIQVNINDEESKSGVAPEHVEKLADSIQASPNLCLRGLMAIPAADQSEESLRQSFKEMKQLFEELKAKVNTVDTLSMGMSGDIEAAIENGSTMVRVGTALFGPRDTRMFTQVNK